MTSEKSMRNQSQTLICSARDSPASLFPLLGSGRVSRILEALFSLRYVGSHQRKNLDYCCSKMSRDSYLTMKDALSQESSYLWMNWGMMSNGRYLTVRISECHKTGNACSLSDILEERVDKRYFLSEKQQIALSKSMDEANTNKIEYTE